MARCGLCAFLLLATATRATLAVEREGAEYQVKAVFVLNFTQFVEWPAAAFATRDAPLVIGVLGTNPFGTLLEATVRNERVGGRPLVVRELDSAADAASCHLLFVSRSESARLLAVLSSLRGRPILTIGESDRFCQTGGMIKLGVQDETVRFEMNPHAAAAAGLHVSAKLLRLGKTVATEAAANEVAP